MFGEGADHNRRAQLDVFTESLCHYDCEIRAGEGFQADIWRINARVLLGTCEAGLC